MQDNAVHWNYGVWSHLHFHSEWRNIKTIYLCDRFDPV